jgi:hypothetical protein
MDTGRRFLLALMAGTFLFGSTANAQDPQSLGDVARRQREQKEQAAVAQGKDSATKVITNEEIPEHTETEPPASKDASGVSRVPSSKISKQTADSWRSRILAEKARIKYLQRRIDEVNGSIRFSSVSCASCVTRNERQVAKQQRVEQMQDELNQEKKRLEEMQETARKQGYGSSVYDP